MIEQIKQSLEYSKLSIESFGAEVILSVELIDQILTVISEVERLKHSNSNLLKQYHQRGKEKDKVIYDLASENTELQKALEQIASYTNPTGEDGREMINIAHEELERSKSL